MTAFKWLVRLRIATNVAIAGYLMLWQPQELAAILGMDAPPNLVWIQTLGVLYIFVTLAYLPSAIAPSRTMPSNVFVLLGPVLPIVLLFAIGWGSRGLMWMALYELVFLVVLNVAFRRGFVAELMQKP
jgi:hypothetical protein